MVIHRFECAMFLPLARERVFDFFSDASNLARITPTEMHFRIVTPQPIGMAAGTTIEYGIRVFGLRLRWLSLISRWDPPREFVDEQLRGPYRQWIHIHRFEEQSDGTQILDHVEYVLPWGLVGRAVHPLVKRRLDAIFQFRQSATRRILLAGASQK